MAHRRAAYFALLGVLLPVAAYAADAPASQPALQITIPAPPGTNLSTASPTTLAHLPPILLDARVSAYMVAISRSVSPSEVETAAFHGTPSTPIASGDHGLPACVSASLKLSSKSTVICSPEPASDLTR
jgi:hypothetical protein